MTTAHLGLAVDSTQVSAATPELARLTAAASQAEGAALRLAAASKIEAAGVSTATTASRMHTVALQAQAAAARMAGNTSRQLAFQLNDVVVSLASGMNPAMVGLQQGSQIAQLGLANVARSLASMAARFAPVAVAVGAVTAAFAAMTHEINRGQKVQVSVIEVMIASWQLFSESVGRALEPVVNWLSGFWDMIAPGVTAGVEALIDTFHLAFLDIKSIWEGLPSALGDAVYSTAQVVLEGVQKMVNENWAVINDLIYKAKAALPFGAGALLNPIAPVNFGEIGNPFEGSMGNLSRSFAKNRADVMGSSTIDAIGSRAREIHLANQELEDVSKNAKVANDNLSDMAGQGLADAAEAAAAVATELAGHVGDAFRDFFSTFRSNLREGMDGWSAFADAGISSLQKLGDKLMDMALDQAITGILDMLLGAFMGAGGIGGLKGIGGGGLTGTLGKPRLFAAGGWTGDAGGIVHPEEFVIRRGPAAQFRPMLEAMNSGANLNMPGAANSNSINITINGSKQDAAAIARELKPMMYDIVDRRTANNLVRR